MKTPVEQLIGLNIVEKDNNGDVILRWTYPSIGLDIKEFLLLKCGQDGDSVNFGSSTSLSSSASIVSSFSYYHFSSSWIYLNQVDCPSGKLNDVRQCTLAILSTDFNPEKYEPLCNLLCQTYLQYGNLTKVLDLYLNLMIQGSVCSDDNGAFIYKDYDQKRIMAYNSNVKQIIKMFGLDVILIYTCLILKKRIAVYHHKPDLLLKFVRSLPAFIWHRCNWDVILYPVVDLTSKAELQDIRGVTHYVAGFLDSNIQNRTDLYDVFVNLAAVEINLAPHAKDTFLMTKTHKEIAVFMTRQADIESNSDIDLIQEISGKTKELINHLKSFTIEIDGTDRINMEAIKERKLAPSLENFLWNLAQSENLV